ncbi:DUF4129 domain-containing protein [Halococcus saccharolyticus]|uniref:Protein-glutamine gamma-glutamyltransferase-like C-terminal domain-containing protein n=1 Tax=Halococcus saccharolyticus DSM 5350 TaxID=1227455 RepID=M0MNE9_9EURY|nr:DUF4129 domain-containing protein [Halococcus saccharolyticus]EMA46269.1 hypothetical protein C449_04530 [Halococcus saccharolyticus DSM 5350]
MNRDALGPVLIAVLAVVALGVGAATLDRIESGGGGMGVSDGDAAGPGSGETLDLGQPPPSESSEPSAIPPLVRRILAVLLIAALLVGLYAWRDDLRSLAVISAALAAGVLLLYFLVSRLGSRSQSGRGGFLGDRKPTLPGGGSLTDGARTVTTESPALAVLVGLVLVVGVVVLFHFARIDGEDEPDTEAEPDDPTTDVAASVGRAAGRAADRIDEEGEATNEVYRAWEEMTDHLDVANPGSSTPREFARAATDAGMTRNDVDELTDLFRTVRYGGRRVTDDREHRAVTALRRIEREYAEDR